MSNYQSPGNGYRADGSSCPTKKVVLPDFYDTFNDEWVMKEEIVPVCRTEDISIGKYRCTVCGDVGYYTGNGGIPAEEPHPERLERLVESELLEKQKEN